MVRRRVRRKSTTARKKPITPEQREGYVRMIFGEHADRVLKWNEIRRASWDTLRTIDQSYKLLKGLGLPDWLLPEIEVLTLKPATIERRWATLKGLGASDKGILFADGLLTVPRTAIRRRWARLKDLDLTDKQIQPYMLNLTFSNIDSYENALRKNGVSDTDIINTAPHLASKPDYIRENIRLFRELGAVDAEIARGMQKLLRGPSRVKETIRKLRQSGLRDKDIIARLGQPDALHD